MPSNDFCNIRTLNIYITMFYRTFIIVILILFTASLMAGEKRYRVEILVLSHLHHEAVPSDAEDLRDFSTSLDFLEAEAMEDKDGEDEDGEAENSEDMQVVDDGMQEEDRRAETGSELLPGEDLPEEPWADVIAVEDMSDVMRETWRRLRLSAPFRPEQYLSWEQSADEPFPSLRIHDPDVLQIDSICTVLSETAAVAAKEKETHEGEDNEDENRPVVAAAQGNILPGNFAEVGVDESVEEAAEEPGLPDSTLFYRIDGTVMLRRSRFLHLDLDIELRQAVFNEQPLTPASIPGSENESNEPELPAPATSFLIHHLKQSRQVKSERMEYFDSPVLGVLAWITPFEAEDEAESLTD